MAKLAIQQAGLYYIKHKMSVIPVGKDKMPLIAWKKYQEELVSSDIFLGWCKRFVDMQIGIVTGKISGIVVVDIDKPDIDLSWLPKTAIAKTGSGGFHYYYYWKENVSNKARIKEWIDIRGDGGYVLAPPSFNLKGQYLWTEKRKLAQFPAHLFGAAEIPQSYKQSKMDVDYVGYGEGQRNDKMTSYIGFILAKIHPSEWESIAVPLIQSANQKNTPPLCDNELMNTYNSIAGKEKNNNADRWYKQKESKLIVKTDYRSRYTWGTQELDMSFAIIKRGNFIIIGAKRSSGKTTFTFDMACKNALLGHKVLYISLEMDECDIINDFARKYSCINIREEYYYEIPEYKKMAFNRKVKEIKSIERLFFRGMRRGDNVNWNSVLNLINDFDDLDLIFIDNLDLIESEGNETDIERQKRITKKIMNFTAEKQIPIILIHHHRKATGKDFGSDELAGSGKIADNADIIIKISRNENPEAVYPEKFETRAYQQKGRGYANAAKTIFFMKGSFEDEPFPVEDYYKN